MAGWLLPGKHPPVCAKCCYWPWVTVVLHTATGWSTTRSRLIPLGTPRWGAAAGQHCPALGAITNIAPTWLSPQPAKAQIHKALTTVESFSSDKFVFRL